MVAGMDQEAPSAQARDSGHENVVASFPMDDVTAFRNAVELLFPGLNVRASSAALWRLAGQRSTSEALRQYLYGPRKAPRWIRDIVAAELKRRAQAYQQGESDMLRLKAGPGKGAPLIRYWQKKRAAQAAQNNHIASTD